MVPLLQCCDFSLAWQAWVRRIFLQATCKSDACFHGCLGGSCGLGQHATYSHLGVHRIFLQATCKSDACFHGALVGLVDLDSMLPTHIWVFTEYSFRQHANQMHVFMAPWWVLWTWTACYLLTSGCSWQATEAISYCHEKGVMHKERLLKASSFSCRKLAPCRKSPAPQLLVLSAGSEVREPSLAAACLLQVDVSVCIN